MTVLLQEEGQEPLLVSGRRLPANYTQGKETNWGTGARTREQAIPAVLEGHKKGWGLLRRRAGALMGRGWVLKLCLRGSAASRGPG